MQTEAQKYEVTQNALGVLRNVADRVDQTKLAALRAAGRLPGEKALDFEFRCLEEAMK